MPNQSRVCPARRAAFVTFRSWVMLATIARKMSGTTATFSSVTYALPIVDRVAVRPFGLPSASGPRFSARMPSRMPAMRAIVIWNPNER